MSLSNSVLLAVMTTLFLALGYLGVPVAFALIAGVSTTGSRKIVSKIVCNWAMTSAWFIGAARDFYFCRDGLERFQPQFKFPFHFRFGDQSKTHPAVKITHHLVLRRRQKSA